MGHILTLSGTEWTRKRGRFPSRRFASFWNGRLNEAVYFDRALSSTELADLKTRMWKRITIQSSVRDNPSVTIVGSRLLTSYLTGVETPYLDVLTSSLSPESAASFTKSGSLTVSPSVRIYGFNTMRGATGRHALGVADRGGSDSSQTASYGVNQNYRQWSIGGGTPVIMELLQ